MKKKYLIIDAKDIKKKIFARYKYSTIDSTEDFYLVKEMAETKPYFDKKEIPEELQKLVLQVNYPTVFSRVDAEELFLGQEYDLNGPISYRKKLIGKQASKIYHDSLISGNISFEINKEYKELDEVLEFVDTLEKTGYIEDYLKVLNELTKVEILTNESIEKIFEKEKTKPIVRKMVK